MPQESAPWGFSYSKNYSVPDSPQSSKLPLSHFASGSGREPLRLDMPLLDAGNSLPHPQLHTFDGILSDFDGTILDSTDGEIGARMVLRKFVSRLTSTSSCKILAQVGHHAI